MDIIGRILGIFRRNKKPPSQPVIDFDISQRQMETMAANAEGPTNPKYEDVSSSDLKPLNGSPGLFTDGRGKGAQDPVTGNSFSKYPVYDADGKYLGENAEAHINGETLKYGYSQGTEIPHDFNLGTTIMTQSEALQSAGLNIEGAASSGQTNSPSEAPISSLTQPQKGAMINGVATPIPQGMHSIEGVGMVMSQDTALKSAGLNSDSLDQFTPTKGGEGAQPTVVAAAAPYVNPAQAADLSVSSPYDSQVTSSHQSSASTAQSMPSSSPMTAEQALRSAGLDGIASSPASITSSMPAVEESPVPTANQLNHQNADNFRPTNSKFGGGASFDIGGPSENPIDGIGGDPGNSAHTAV